MPKSNKMEYDRRLDRFKREARILADISHPGIVRVSDYFEENDTAFGNGFDSWLYASRLLGAHRGAGPAENVVAHLGEKLIEAVSASHSRQVYHLDIKPRISC